MYANLSECDFILISFGGFICVGYIGCNEGIQRRKDDTDIWEVQVPSVETMSFWLESI